ncbi:Hypothetical protein UVM_LOCUS293 [uncultured virus]|nr:Hypothetical protein UVM_LOCUS293 [uncultured virus]
MEISRLLNAVEAEALFPAPVTNLEDNGGGSGACLKPTARPPGLSITPTPPLVLPPTPPPRGASQCDSHSLSSRLERAERYADGLETELRSTKRYAGKARREIHELRRVVVVQSETIATLERELALALHDNEEQRKKMLQRLHGLQRELAWLQDEVRRILPHVRKRLVSPQTTRPTLHASDAVVAAGPDEMSAADLGATR